MSKERADGDINLRNHMRDGWSPIPGTEPIDWVCPKCGNVLAPFMAYCVHCVGREVVPPTLPVDPTRTGGLPPYTGQPQIFCKQ